MITISSPRVFQVAGVPAIEIPAGAGETRVAGEAAYVVGNAVIFRVGSAVGKCGNGAPHQTHYRRVDGFTPVSEAFKVNARGSAASVVITMEAGHEFEARGYARNAEWQRYCFDGSTVARL